MAKVFDVKDFLDQHPDRNNFDLTHKVHGSYSMGTLYPVLCKPVVPGDSFNIDTAISARFMPMPFPTQSNIRCVFHFFYQRAKNVWPNFENWIQGLEEHTPPYIYQPFTFYKTGGLADRLDIPTNLVRNSAFRNVDENFTTVNYWLVPDSNALGGSFTYITPADMNRVNSYSPAPNNPSIDWPTLVPDANYGFSTEPNMMPTYAFSDLFYGCAKGSILTAGHAFNMRITTDPSTLGFEWDSSMCYIAFALPKEDSYAYVTRWIPVELSYSSGKYYFNLPSDFELPFRTSFEGAYTMLFAFKVTVSGQETTEAYYTPLKITQLSFQQFIPAQVVEVSEDKKACPYYGDNNVGDDTIKVSALPFRVYESVYWSFYANTQGVQPFQIDGVTKYNRYNTTTDDGQDSTPYHFFQHNWELDAYTSCLPDAQQGNVPYVGITDISALGEARIACPDGTSASVRLSDNGEGVQIENLSAETPEARRFALRAASSGFTIPEFREANALQRWLELGIRKGYRYVDFLKGHFGVAPKHQVMDMPEFLGGFTQRLSVNDVSNTNGIDFSDELGRIAGQARCVGGSAHGVTRFFDDFGFVMCIMSIVPDTAYNCILPKHFNIKSNLDMYFPEFNSFIQPITYEEVAPVQSHFEHENGQTGKVLTNVFGYQRPNHDLVWYCDTVHGDFRLPNKNSSVICRSFVGRPELGSDFLTIKPSETDSIFNYTLGDGDICLGEIVFSIHAKRPLPRIVIPHL